MIGWLLRDLAVDDVVVDVVIVADVAVAAVESHQIERYKLIYCVPKAIININNEYNSMKACCTPLDSNLGNTTCLSGQLTFKAFMVILSYGLTLVDECDLLVNENLLLFPILMHLYYLCSL